MAIMELTAPQGRYQSLKRAFNQREWRKITWMMVTIVALHVVGFGILIAFVVPGHYKGFGIGLGVLAYTLGLRHAFDADHISAIDNTTRKLLNERHDVEGTSRPLTLGYYFSLGHSTIVVAIGLGLVFAERAVFHAVSNNNSGLEQFGGLFGTVVSASFLLLFAC
jgi:high-affinity nickel-transport protein